VGCEKVACTKA